MTSNDHIVARKHRVIHFDIMQRGLAIVRDVQGIGDRIVSIINTQLTTIDHAIGIGISEDTTAMGGNTLGDINFRRFNDVYGIGHFCAAIFS